MSHANPALMLRLLKSTLSKNNVDYDRLAEEFGQLTSAERRRNRESFSLSDHVRGLVLSQLSANRPWKPIAANLSKLATLFKDYDWVYLKSVDPDILVSGILDLKCGSRTTRFQITSLKSNIETFENIQRHFGQIDRFIESAPPETIARHLSKKASPYKLKWVGFPLALEYLRNVGIQSGKPDTHICRILGRDRLGYSDHAVASEAEAYEIIIRVSDELSVNPTYLDTLLWLLCSEGYANICGANPRCHLCDLAAICNYPRNAEIA